MRIVVGGLLLLFWAANAPMTSVEYHARYGKPDVERFMVRSGLMLTVEYGPDEQVCRMRIEPYHNLSHPFLNDAAAPMDEISAFLNEVVPPEVRGKELGPGETKSRCSGATPPTEFENVTVIPFYWFCERPPVDRGIDVLFKRPHCEGLPKYSEN